MSLLRQRIACLRPITQAWRAAYMSTSSTPDVPFFDEVAADSAPTTSPPASASPSSPPPSSPFPDVDESKPPTGEAYPIEANPVRFAESQASQITHRRKPLYAIYFQSNQTNTITTISAPDGKVLRVYSGGKLKFKGANRSSYEAGYQCAVAAFGVLEKQMEVAPGLRWQLFLKGFGQGREAMIKAITGNEGANVRDSLRGVTDRTPIKVGGTRSKKMKRR